MNNPEIRIYIIDQDGEREENDLASLGLDDDQFVDLDLRMSIRASKLAEALKLLDL